MSENQKLFALLIDGDHATPVLKLIPQVLDKVKEHGNPTIRRVYGNEGSIKSWATVIVTHGLEAIAVPKNTKSKNVADFALVIAAMELVHSHPELAGFCIITSDGDFTELANHIKAKDKFVLGIGAAQTPKSFMQACSEFIYVEDLSTPLTSKAKSAKTKLPSPKASLVPALKTNTSKPKTPEPKPPTPPTPKSKAPAPKNSIPPTPKSKAPTPKAAIPKTAAPKSQPTKPKVVKQPTPKASIPKVVATKVTMPPSPKPPVSTPKSSALKPKTPAPQTHKTPELKATPPPAPKAKPKTPTPQAPAPKPSSAKSKSPVPQVQVTKPKETTSKATKPATHLPKAPATLALEAWLLRAYDNAHKGESGWVHLPEMRESMKNIDEEFAISFVRAYDNAHKGESGWVHLREIRQGMKNMDDEFESRDYQSTRVFAEKAKLLAGCYPGIIEIDEQLDQKLVVHYVRIHLAVRSEFDRFCKAYKHATEVHLVNDDDGWVKMAVINEMLWELYQDKDKYNPLYYRGIPYAQLLDVAKAMKRDYPDAIEIIEHPNGHSHIRIRS